VCERGGFKPELEYKRVPFHCKEKKISSSEREEGIVGKGGKKVEDMWWACCREG
jgi:hypothetical protein